jgi:hypothetical protein
MGSFIYFYLAVGVLLFYGRIVQGQIRLWWQMKVCAKCKTSSSLHMSCQFCKLSTFTMWSCNLVNNLLDISTLNCHVIKLFQPKVVTWAMVDPASDWKNRDCLELAPRAHSSTHVIVWHGDNQEITNSLTWWCSEIIQVDHWHLPRPPLINY